MRYTLCLLLLLASLSSNSCSYNPAGKAKKQELPDIKLPPGFNISYFAKDIDPLTGYGR